MNDEKKTYSQDDVLKAWNDKVGKQDQYDLVEIETADGDSQTQLLDKTTGSISIAVDGTGDKVLRKLYERAGDTFIDGAESPVEAVGAKSVKRYTSSGVLATPTQPEVLEAAKEPTEVNPKEDTGRKTAQELAETPEDKIKPADERTDRSAEIEQAQGNMRNMDPEASDEEQPQDDGRRKGETDGRQKSEQER